MPQVSNFSLMNFQQNWFNSLRNHFSRIKHPPTTILSLCLFGKFVFFSDTQSKVLLQSPGRKQSRVKARSSSTHLCTPLALQQNLSHGLISSPATTAGHFWESKTLDQDVGSPVSMAHLAIMMGKTKGQSLKAAAEILPEYHITRQHILVIKHACFHRISNLSLKQLVLSQLVFFFPTINSNCIINAAQAQFYSTVFKLQLQSGQERGDAQD